MDAKIPFQCPVTAQPLQLSSADELITINAALKAQLSTASPLCNVEGVSLDKPLTAAWINSSKTHAYIDQRGIPVLVPDAAISL